MKEKLAQNTAPCDSAQESLLPENARLRGDFLTIAVRISQVLRTPLGGIVNTGELLQEILLEKDPAAAALADSLFTSVDELSKLIGQIRMIAKATANPRPKERVSTAEIVSGVLQRLESRILKSHATLVQPDSWPEVNGVDDWLEFIWWNLLTNALQHAGEKPQIELSWHREKNWFRFEVCMTTAAALRRKPAPHCISPSIPCTNPAVLMDWGCQWYKGWLIYRVEIATMR